VVTIDRLHPAGKAALAGDSAEAARGVLALDVSTSFSTSRLSYPFGN